MRHRRRVSHRRGVRVQHWRRAMRLRVLPDHVPAMSAMRWMLLAALALAACNSTCGGQGQACCSNLSCNALLACTGIAGNPQSFKCEPCGMIGAPCCGTQPQCASGATCRMTVDTGPHCFANGDGGTPDGGIPDAGEMQCAPSGGCTAGPSCGGV